MLSLYLLGPSEGSIGPLHVWEVSMRRSYLLLKCHCLWLSSGVRSCNSLLKDPQVNIKQTKKKTKKTEKPKTKKTNKQTNKPYWLIFCWIAIHEATWSQMISRFALQVLLVLFSTACFPLNPYTTHLSCLPTSQVWFHRSVKIYSKLER